jgi:hypothetical protein
MIQKRQKHEKAGNEKREEQAVGITITITITIMKRRLCTAVAATFVPA